MRRVQWAHTFAVWAVSVVIVGGRANVDTWPQTAAMAALEQGETLYLSRCVSCHGVDGDEIPKIGVLTGQFRRPYTDAQLVTLIRTGIAGTAMAPTTLTDEQAALVVAYLRWAASADEPQEDRASASGKPTGNPDRGRALYVGKGGCAVCHRIHGVGGHLGPDLSGVGRRLRPTELAQSMAEPDADVRPGTSIARVVAADGAEIVGRLLDQDTDLLHLVTQEGRALVLSRATVRQLDVQTTSGMPAYVNVLTAAEVAEIVSYLQTLSGPHR